MSKRYFKKLMTIFVLFTSGCGHLDHSKSDSHENENPKATPIFDQSQISWTLKTVGDHAIYTVKNLGTEHLTYRNYEHSSHYFAVRSYLENERLFDSSLGFCGTGLAWKNLGSNHVVEFSFSIEELKHVAEIGVCLDQSINCDTESPRPVPGIKSLALLIHFATDSFGSNATWVAGPTFNVP